MSERNMAEEDVHYDRFKDSYKQELISYAVPYLQLPDDEKTKIPAKDILTVSNAQIIIVQGEEGTGKTALTKYIFQCWDSENMDDVNNLAEFDIAIKVDSELGKLWTLHELVFPFTLDKENWGYFSNEFPSRISKTTRKDLCEMKVLWIVDGLCRNFGYEYKLPRTHRVIIVTSPDRTKIQKKLFSGLTQIVLTLQPNITDIAKKMIPSRPQFKEFKTAFDTLDNSVITFLSIPINMKMFIDLWLNYRSLVEVCCSPKILFLKTINLRLWRLVEDRNKHLKIPPTELYSLVKKTKQWLYGSFCRHMFLMVAHFEFIITCEVIECIKASAVDLNLDPNSCLSAFLLESPGENGESSYYFQQSSHIYIYASIFLRNINKFNLRIKDIVNKAHFYAPKELLIYFLGIAVEDGSINSDTQQIFNIAQELICLCKFSDQCFLWYIASTSAKFNTNFMEYVAQALKSYLYFSMTHFTTFYQTNKFMDYINPKKIVMRDSYMIVEKDNYLELMNTLTKKEVEIYIDAIYNENNFKDEISAFTLVNSLDLNLTSFSGTIDKLRLLNVNKRNRLADVTIRIFSEDDFHNLCSFLQENETLVNIQIVFSLWDFFTSSEAPKFPRKHLMHASITVSYLCDKNIENFIDFLCQIKDGQESKFKAISHYCGNLIPEHQMNLLEKHAFSIKLLMPVRGKFERFGYPTLHETSRYLVKRVPHYIGQSSMAKGPDQFLHPKRQIHNSLLTMAKGPNELLISGRKQIPIGPSNTSKGPNQSLCSERKPIYLGPCVNAKGPKESLRSKQQSQPIGPNIAAKGPNASLRNKCPLKYTGPNIETKGPNQSLRSWRCPQYIVPKTAARGPNDALRNSWRQPMGKS